MKSTFRVTVVNRRCPCGNEFQLFKVAFVGLCRRRRNGLLREIRPRDTDKFCSMPCQNYHYELTHRRRLTRAVADAEVALRSFRRTIRQRQKEK